MYRRRKKSNSSPNRTATVRRYRSSDDCVIRRRRLFEFLEDRQLLATITPVAISGGYELQLAYETSKSETVGDLPDVHLRTDDSGYLEYSQTEDGTYTRLGVNLWNDSVTSQTIKVTYEAQSDSDYVEVVRNLFDNNISTLHLQGIEAPGVDLSFSALAINVDQKLSTRDIDPQQVGFDLPSEGDSGDISLDASVINTNARIDASVLDGDATHQAGDITLTATGNLDDIASGFIVVPGPIPDVSLTRASIDIDAGVYGRDITIDVESDASDLFNDEDSPGGVGEPIEEYIGSISVGAGVAVSKSSATIDITSAVIQGRHVSLSTKSDSDAEARVLTAFAAVAYGQSEPLSTIDINGFSSIETTGDLDITTHADSELSIEATQNLIGTSTTTEKYNVTLNAAYSNLTSKASVGKDSRLEVGNDLTIDVGGHREHLTGSNAAAYGDGTLGLAINVAVHDSTLEALIDGEVTTGGNMVVDAELNTSKNDFNATSTVGTGQLGGRLQSSWAGTPLSAATGLVNNIFSSTSSAVEFDKIRQPGGAGQKQPNKYGLAASINVGIGHNQVEVRIGPDNTVNVGGDLILRGHAEEFPETSALSFLNSSNLYLGQSYGSYSQRETGIAGAITVGYFEQDVDVYIGNNADVTVAGDLSLSAESSIPYDPQYIWNFKLGEDADFEDPKKPGTYTDKFNYNLGIQNGLFSSWSEAIASAEERAVGVMVNAMLGNTRNVAYIGDGAQVIVGGDVSVIADTAIDTINFVGSPLIPFNATGGTGIGAAFMATGYANETTSRINPLASVKADSLLVLANNRGRNISIGIQGGLSDGHGGFNGAFTSGFVDNRTIAKISAAADIELGNGLVAVPISMETLRQDENSFSTTVSQFNPTESYYSEDASLKRVNVTENTITMPYDPGLNTGDALLYDSDGGDDIGGLKSGAVEAASLATGAGAIFSEILIAAPGDDLPVGISIKGLSPSIGITSIPEPSSLLFCSLAEPC